MWCVHGSLRRGTGNGPSEMAFSCFFEKKRKKSEKKWLVYRVMVHLTFYFASKTKKKPLKLRKKNMEQNTNIAHLSTHHLHCYETSFVNGRRVLVRCALTTTKVG